MYDLVIVGAGPGGSAAAVYAARKKIKTLLITKEFGGQSTVSPEIQNWVGDVSVSGNDLAKRFEEHVRAYAGECVTIKEGVYVSEVTQSGNEHFTVTTDSNETFDARAVLVTAGGTRRKLPVPGAEEFDQKGLTYCASCDGPLFSGQDVVVVGGGNAGFETAAQLLAYTKSVTLLQRSGEYKADKVTVERVLAHENMTGILNADITEVFGDTFVKGVKYKDADGTEHTLDVTGVFVEIGMVPSTGFVKELVELDQHNRIIVDPKNQRTSLHGVWAAGDCTNGLYHQNNIAAGDAVKAVEDLYLCLKAGKQ